MKIIMNIIVALSLLAFPGCKWFACDCGHEGHDHAHALPTPAAPTTPAPEASATPSAAAPATTPEVPAAETLGVIKISSAQEFEEKVIGAKKPVLVDFSAKWCGPCQSMKPIVEELAHEMGAKYIFAEVSVDDASDVANKYGIQGIPTFTFFKDGKEVVSPADRLTGAMDKNTLKAAIEKKLG